jgi:tetratricopeptide (TPR) repeat protein
MSAPEEERPQARQMMARASLTPGARRLIEVAADQALVAAETVGNGKLTYKVQTAMSAAFGGAQRNSTRRPGHANSAAESSRPRAESKWETAQRLLEAGDVAAARPAAIVALTDSLEHEGYWSWKRLLSAMAGQLIEVAGRDEAEAVMTSALAGADELGSVELAGVAKQLAGLGLPESAQLAGAMALEATARSAGGADRAKDLARVAELLAHADLNEAASSGAARALIEGQRERDVGLRALALGDVAYALTEAGNPEMAQVAATQALADAANMVKPASRGRILAKVSERLVWAGQTDLAERAAQSAAEAARAIPEGRPRDDLLATAATALIKVGHTGLAAETARSIRDDYRRDRALCDVAEALAQEDLPEDAAAIVNLIEGNSDRSTAINRIADIFNPDRRSPALEAFAGAINDRVAQVKIFNSLAEKLAHDGRTARSYDVIWRSFEIIPSISGPREQSDAWTKIAPILARMGEDDLARRAALSVTPEWQRGDVLTGLVRILIAIGEIEKSRGMAAAALSEARASHNVRIFVTIAGMLAELGDTQWADQAVSEGLTIARDRRDPDALLTVARWKAASGALGEASAVTDESLLAARRVSDSSERAQTLVRVAEILIDTGRAEDALVAATEAVVAAQSVGDPNDRARELAQVATALIDMFGPFDVPPPDSSGGRPTRGDGEAEASYEKRYLVCRAPQNVRRSSDFSIVVQISEQSSTAGGAPFLTPPIPGAGARLHVILHVPAGCSARSESIVAINLPAQGDSGEAHFNVRAADADGRYRFGVTVLWGSISGQILAREAIEIAVSAESTGLSTSARYPTLPAAFDQAAVELVVARSSARRYLYVLSRPGYSPITDELRLDADPRPRLKLLTGDLNNMSKGRGWRPAGMRDELRARGSELWRDFLPEKIKDAIADLRAGQDTLCVSSESPDLAVPWEMLHPIDRGESDFLVQLFDVIRSPETTAAWCGTMNLTPAAIVVPGSQLPGTMEEAHVIGEMLGLGVSYIREKVALQQELQAGQFGLLHVAAHSRDGDGSIRLAADQKFQLWDINDFTAGGGRWSDRRPLVFINACGTAGSRQTFTRYASWSQRFFEAGAGGFVGTMWDVRSETASAFAQSFYQAFYVEGRSFGGALHAAREDARSHDTDPTWLAYAAHGDHKATASEPPGLPAKLGPVP